MAQQNWLYVNDEGKRFHVGLFHGARSGHFMVYCNARVMLIDFHVLQNKSYSFFIEDELCEIKVEQTNGHFSYRFEINKNADTPRNRQRKRRDRRELWQTLAFVGALLLAVGGFYFWWQSRQRPPDADELTAILEKTGQEAIARVTEIKPEAAKPVRYVFIAQGRSYESRLAGPFPAPPHGLPLETGDEFAVRYATRAPSINQIDFSRPTEQQIIRYQQRTLARHLDLNPSLREDQARCQVELAFSIEGLDGLADFYFQDTSPEENPDHNRLTYQRLVRDVPFRQQNQEECW